MLFHKHNFNTYNEKKVNNLKLFRSIDIKLLITALILCLLGLLFVYSASNIVSLEEFNDSFYYLKRQGLFFIISCFISYFIIKMDLSLLKSKTIYIFFFATILLIIVLIPGIGVVRGGARSWISILGFSIQPSEFMKVAIILLFAKFLSDYDKEISKLKTFVFLLAVCTIIFGIILLQPDFGTGLVLFLSCLLLIFCAGGKIKYFVILGVLGILAFTFLIIISPYRLERITAFLNPWEDPLGSGFQGIQSMLAITPGGLFGHGFNASIQKHFFLPEPQNDFIFAIILEEIGLIGGIFILSLYCYLFYRGIKNAINTEDKFIKYLQIGIIFSLATQVFINTGVVVGLLPVTGITLPLFSYGGSSLLISITEIALLISASKYAKINEML